MKRIPLDMFTVFFIGISLITSYFLIAHTAVLFIDEYFHYEQIERFMQGNTTLVPGLMTLPGYHLIIAFLGRLLGATNVGSVRTVAFFVNLLAIFAFYFAAKKSRGKHIRLKLLQFAYLPILFPFFPFIYTDIVSTGLVIFSIFNVLKKQYWLAGIVAAASITVRQNNIVWTCFILALIYIQEYGWQIKRGAWKDYIRKSFLVLLTILFSSIFFLFNNGLVLSAYARSYVHISWSLLDNAYFALFLSFFIFLPFHLTHIPFVLQAIRKRKWILFIILAVCPFFLATSRFDHPFNQNTWFLHNALLHMLTRTVLPKILFYFILSYSLISILTMRMLLKRYYLIYPFAFLYLLPYWLVEARYFMIPFSLFILFKKENHLRISLLTVMYYLCVSSYILVGITRGWFFP